MVYLIFQRYKFKSKSQPLRIWNPTGLRCIWYFKDTNSKANHNHVTIRCLRIIGVFDISKIQIQKQITTTSLLSKNNIGCIWYFKDTNSKANHNLRKPKRNARRVYLIFQRYKFKSKSQLMSVRFSFATWCIWYFKDTNSKANHNKRCRD